MVKINKEKQLALPQKLLLELFDYDGETGEWVNKTNRGSRARKGQPAGYVDKSTGYVRIWINGYRHQAHRLAWTYVYGDYPQGEHPFVDRINGKRDDNRIENLRVSSSGENNRNQKMMLTNTTGVTGVYRSEKKNLSGKIYPYWIATWYTEKGKLQTKQFPVHKLGENEAKQAATEHRTEQLQLLKVSHGVVYSDRHGT
jgi:hypothetical protein